MSLSIIGSSVNHNQTSPCMIARAIVTDGTRGVELSVDIDTPEHAETLLTGFEYAVKTVNALCDLTHWTPTSDLASLPPFDTYVIVYTTKEFRTIAVRSYNGCGRGWTWRGNGRMYCHDEITHWMTLPEAPEKEVVNDVQTR